MLKFKKIQTHSEASSTSLQGQITKWLAGLRVQKQAERQLRAHTLQSNTYLNAPDEAGDLKPQAKCGTSLPVKLQNQEEAWEGAQDWPLREGNQSR